MVDKEKIIIVKKMCKLGSVITYYFRFVVKLLWKCCKRNITIKSIAITLANCLILDWF